MKGLIDVTFIVCLLMNDKHISADKDHYIIGKAVLGGDSLLHFISVKPYFWPVIALRSSIDMDS